MQQKHEVTLTTLAMVCQGRSGKWEVRIAHVEAETNAQSWRHYRYYDTEQLAEAAARSLLPYCDTAWHPQNELAPGRLAEKLRVPWHKYRTRKNEPGEKLPSGFRVLRPPGVSSPTPTVPSGAS